jgi:flavin reductase (DIM6/NTAB) family NADH-FMN oxidoreductase RutF/uncharacterized protein YciI
VEFAIVFHRSRPEAFPDEAVREHVDRLAELDDQGRLIVAGPLGDGTGGLILARFDDLSQARRFAETDPYVTGGWETVEVHPWSPAHRANDYLDPTLAARHGPSERHFVALPLDKRDWPCSPLPGQIVLVTTLDTEGEVDIAPKSWLSMAAFSPPIIGFGCTITHRTYVNVTETGQFVINVLPSRLAPRAWAMLSDYGNRRVKHADLSFLPAASVAPPRVAECVAHFECIHQHTVEFDGGEVFIFGRIVSATIDERCLHDDLAIAYGHLDACFFLQNRLWVGLGPPAGVPLS